MPRRNCKVIIFSLLKANLPISFSFEILKVKNPVDEALSYSAHRVCVFFMGGGGSFSTYYDMKDESVNFT